MNKLRSLTWRLLWGIFALATLAGCGALKGMGHGLGDAFKRIKLP
jgi:hypothetical protein